MITRYSTPEMQEVWSEERKFEHMYDVEQAFVEACEYYSDVPKGTSNSVKARRPVIMDISKIREIERRTKHETAAFVEYCQSQIGDAGRYFHTKLTSSDVLDTALALQLQSVGSILGLEARLLCRKLAFKAVEHQNSVILGRTHGRAAEPTTLGLKLLVLFETLSDNLRNFIETTKALQLGKLAGPVGSLSGLSTPAIEDYALASMGLESTLGTQVLSRHYFTRFALDAIQLASAVENIALQIRLLSQTGIEEVSEGFGAEQKGSSSMPQKRNPIHSEQITGICRMIRSHAPMMLENVSLWGERDMTHSSVERVALEDITTLLHYALKQTHDLLDGLVFNKHRAWTNLTEAEWGQSKVLQLLLDSGEAPEIAYRKVQGLLLTCGDTSGIPANFIDAARDPATYLRHVPYLFERSLGKNYMEVFNANK